ncbi:copper resistance protein NlpE N-terminal domain-containing protein [Marinobacteraceae bacterium S3BR75-40.1]
MKLVFQQLARGAAATLLLFTLSACVFLEPGAPSDAPYGRWGATIPSGNALALKAYLTLWDDPNHYRFSKVYEQAQAAPKPYVEKGTWTLEEQASGLGLIHLKPSEEGQEKWFQRNADGSLQWLNADGTPRQPMDDYRLPRVEK